MCGVVKDVGSSNGTDLSCQCIKVAGKKQLDAALQQELIVADHVHQFDASQDCGGQVISDVLTSFFDVDSRSWLTTITLAG